MKVKIKKLDPKAQIPKQATEFSGGWDVVATEIIQESNDFVICKLGFALELPKGYKLTLVPRSSLTKTHWILQNSPGLGDQDYTGEYQYRFRALPIDIGWNNKQEYCLTYSKFPYKVGDRIGQVYLEEVIPIEFEEVTELSDTERSTGGFGSTGA
jgi:dUTP pyrophosphatase